MSWARLQMRATCELRFGAWYPVTGLTGRDVQVQVRGRLVVVSRSLLELRTTPPQQWTVVPPGVDPKRPIVGIRDGYLVCPSCRHRETTPELPVPMLRCARCNGAFAIAWHDPYPRGEAAGRVPPPHTRVLASDKRTAPRRPHSERRERLERRGAERRTWLSAVTFPERRNAARRTRPRRSGSQRRGGLERREKVARS